jgi:hypothetical protein
MKELFKDIMNVDGIEGVLLFTSEGKLIYNDVTTKRYTKPKESDWIAFINGLAGIREADLAFESMRMYIRKTDSGFLVILLANSASMAMVRLNCDILLPSLKQDAGGKGIGRFFKLKK